MEKHDKISVISEFLRYCSYDDAHDLNLFPLNIHKWINNTVKEQLN